MKYVLFVCNHNAGRSQMAQALFERHAPADVRAESARVDARRRSGRASSRRCASSAIDLARPPAARSSTVEMQLHADWAVTMGCGDACPYVPDDASRTGTSPTPRTSRSRSCARSATRSRHARPTADRRAARRRSARTAPPTRCGWRGCCRTSSTEFDGLRTSDEIRACADAILDDYERGARSARFVMTVAHRRTRECLREATSCARASPAAASGVPQPLCDTRCTSGRRAAAEGLAAFALVFAGCGAIVTDADTTAPSARSGSRSCSG